jgi:iron complex outermembrane receptor protein
VDYRYRSSFWFEPSIDRSLFEGGYGLVDARVSLTAPGSKWSVDLWGRNLTDQRYRTFAQAIGFATAGLSAATSRTGDPRTVGVTLRWNL